MADYAERYANKQAALYAKKIKEVYEQAAREVKQKLKEFEDRHKIISAKMLKDVADGKITKEDYQIWLRGQVFQGEQWKRKLKDITKVYVEADKKAREILGGTTKNVFVESANYTAYSIEKDLSGAVAFNIYDHKTVDRLMRDNPKMLPEWKINEKKDYIWNEQRVQNAITQGIIQGESVYAIGQRLTSELSAQNASKMDMFARTAVTGAQNAGRVERMHEADEEFGIKSQKVWITVGDSRVRDAHADLDGIAVDYDEPFIVPNDGRKIDYPGDPSAEPDLVYNCRCSLIYKNKYMKGDYSKESHFLPEYASYNKWKQEQLEKASK